ncbi:MAG: invasion associated locus B family protein [Silicimonas sp.]|nr:invasion associated locus B family protein [Silicimonas sp.]
MQFTVKPILAASLLALLPLTGFAQSADTAEEAPAEAPAEAAVDASESPSPTGTIPGTDLSAGVAEGEEQKVGQTYIQGEHGDWEMRCIRTEDGKDPCQLYQLLVDDGGNAVAEINFFTVPGNDQIVAGATIVTPLETLLTANLRLAVDGGKGRVYPFSFCQTIGCFSRLGFTEAEVGQFRAGNTARVTIVPAAAPDQKVALQASLTGFTAGWKALVAAAKAAE